MGHAKSNSGFSTAEMLLATMILGLSMTLLANGAAVIQSIYRRMLATADAQMILSQVETRLRNDLSMATGYKKISDDAYYYLNGCWYRLKIDNGVLYKEGFEAIPPEADAQGELDQISFKNTRRLENLSINSLPAITRNGDCFYVSGLCVEYKDGQNHIIFPENSPNPQFVIRALQSASTGE